MIVKIETLDGRTFTVRNDTPGVLPKFLRSLATHERFWVVGRKSEHHIPFSQVARFGVSMVEDDQ